MVDRDQVMRILIIVIITIIVVYFLYKYYNELVRKHSEEPIIIKDITTAQGKESMLPDSSKQPVILPSPDGVSYTFMMWMLVNDMSWGGKNKKPVFNRGGRLPQPNIVISSDKNNLEITFTTKDKNSHTEIVENFPLDRWFHVAIVSREHSIDIYIDGGLYRSVAMNTPLLSITNDTPMNGPNYGGYISQLRYYNKALSHILIKNIYTKGPKPFSLLDMSFLFNKYIPKIKLDIDVTIGNWSAKKFVKKNIIKPIKDDIINPIDELLQPIENILHDGG